jgi:hypothetical protein
MGKRGEDRGEGMQRWWQQGASLPAGRGAGLRSPRVPAQAAPHWGGQWAKMTFLAASVAAYWSARML